MASEVRGVSLTAPARAEGVRIFRKHASVLFARWAMNTDERDIAELVISELLTNAVMHGRDKMTLMIDHGESHLEIAVVDHGGAEKPMLPARHSDDHGRGLALVAAVTQGLNIDEMATGWRVRARMSLASPAPGHSKALKR
ncbi:ATP-binding protein [Streptomyces sp. NPDC017964]|uniref:ATP-binding protein n=1 Tax=Streptomyces sp. NPDC017964 TaxID=3365022 RepID=UPI0037B22ADC